ncbi:type VI secretion system baseplate subunit TssF [Methylobacterium sp. 37f]|uniref:type VI secretion system baseplate subunit TssF n=1 Tax=Methylobacterium sp. 37f TaxID=2817058 RepID=UPI001FFD1799|nr:type VI secretion system baseplate subunit TssF [Methylobacterium sp. 37f]MCK2056117.1 type VI secretion system baseplate subunit TssF [Methylobacterium sp. 37f]
MNQEFLDLYNRELGLLREQAREFATEFPGIAERLGGLLDERSDPMILGLLEGAAFLAARVQLKLKHEFPEFTTNLLEQLVPNYLAPTPSALLAVVAPTFGDAALRMGRTIPRGAYLDATHREQRGRVACRFRTTANLTIWPFEVTRAEYASTPGPLQVLGIPTGKDTVAGLRLSLSVRTAARREDELPETVAARSPEAWFKGCPVDRLPIHLVGSEADAVAILEQMIAHRTEVFLRRCGPVGDPTVIRLPESVIEPLGFGPDEALVPEDKRVFEGFNVLRDYFLFPRKFLGFALTGLRPFLETMEAQTIDIVIGLREANGRLSAAVKPDVFALHAVSAINLFRMSLDRVPVVARQHEYHLVPDRSRWLDFEVQQIQEVYAHYAGRADKVRVPPLYGDESQPGGRPALGYTIRRRSRRRTNAERTHGVASDYTGSDVFLSLVEPIQIDSAADEGVVELSVRALCTNRHLPEQLPIGEGAADFHFIDDTQLTVTCAAGPTAPREAVVSAMRSRTETAHTGAVAWRLVNILSLNHLGLVARGAGGNAEALREILMLFADLKDSAVERRIRGVRSIDSRPVVRRLTRRTGTGIARGTEITVELEEKTFEGSGVFLLGAVLDRFFAEYAGLNHFTQTVLRTPERGEIMRWPPRVGARRPL